MKTLNTILAVTGGVLCGVAIGVLLAPKSGKETREDIGRFIKEKGDCLKEKAADVKAAVCQTSEDEHNPLGKVKEIAHKLVNA